MNILVVAAHPDDEVLGCGGTIARHAETGDHVYIAILSEGMMARAKKSTNNDLITKQKKLKEQSFKAASILGAKEVIHYDLPDNKMDQVELLRVIKIIEKCIGNLKPEIIYTHFAGDLNIDHSVVSRAVTTATRPIGKNFVSEVYAFEVLSSTEWAFSSDPACFRPNHFIGIEDYLDKKMEAISVYETETNVFPHPRSTDAIRALALRRGSQAGLKAAEGFMLIRRIVQ